MCPLIITSRQTRVARGTKEKGHEQKPPENPHVDSTGTSSRLTHMPDAMLHVRERVRESAGECIHRSLVSDRASLSTLLRVLRRSRVKPYSSSLPSVILFVRTRTHTKTRTNAHTCTRRRTMKGLNPERQLLYDAGGPQSSTSTTPLLLWPTRLTKDRKWAAGDISKISDLPSEWALLQSWFLGRKTVPWTFLQLVLLPVPIV
jgi:hypothetical protein